MLNEELHNCEICQKVCELSEMSKSGFLLIGVVKWGKPICQKCAKRNALGKGWYILLWASSILPIIVICIVYLLEFLSKHKDFFK